LKNKMRKNISADDRDPYLRKLKDPHSFTVNQLLSKSLVSLFVMTGKANTYLQVKYVRIWIKELNLYKFRLLQNKKGKKLDIAYQVKIKEINNVISRWHNELLVRHNTSINIINRNSKIEHKKEKRKWRRLVHVPCGKVMMDFANKNERPQHALYCNHCGGKMERGINWVRLKRPVDASTSDESEHWKTNAG
jgi:hypothetical protein